tara:strand:+ start:752 stop:1087 length:336 start_codon:yes stop_codon:yes gene_type:complete
MTSKSEKAELVKLRAEMKALKASEAKEKKQNVSNVCPDGFYTLKRIEADGKGKDLRVQAIVKDGKITGSFLANLFGGYDGHAKGAHISTENLDMVIEAIQNADMTKFKNPE